MYKKREKKKINKHIYFNDDKLYFKFLMVFCFFMVFATLLVGIINKQWSYLYTVLLVSGLFITGKLLSSFAYKKTFNVVQAGYRPKKVFIVLKSVFVFTIINVLYVLPFIIVWLTILLTTNGVVTVDSYTNSAYFNLWILLGWLFFLIIFSTVFKLAHNFNKRINTRRRYCFKKLLDFKSNNKKVNNL